MMIIQLHVWYFVVEKGNLQLYKCYRRSVINSWEFVHSVMMKFPN